MKMVLDVNVLRLLSVGSSLDDYLFQPGGVLILLDMLLVRTVDLMGVKGGVALIRKFPLLL